MSICLPKSLLLTGLTTTFHLQLSQHLRPLGTLSRVVSDNTPFAYSVAPLKAAPLRAAPVRTASSRPPSSTWCSSSISGARNVSVKGHAASQEALTDSLSVGLKGKEVQIPLMWLRDHCRCQACYNPDTYQKNVDSYSLENLAVVWSDVDGDTLTVTWQDNHVSKYHLQWLEDNFYSAGFQAERFLWDGPGMNNEPLPTTPFDLHMETEEGLKKTLSNLIKYGFCIVDGALATAEGTERVTERVSFPLETVFGRISVMVSGHLDHSDTAYTSVPLGAHTDTTYFTVPAGIQVFQCLQHDGEGGHTLLVDGFHAAEELRQRDPASFECLATTQIPHEYIEGSHYHLYSMGTVLSTDVISGQLTQIRFNPYDRAPLRTVSAKNMAQFYSSYDALTRIIRAKASEFWIKLNPGMVLLVDNWRVMHGRSGFTGRRALCGLYLPRDDWMSRARSLGLL